MADWFEQNAPSTGGDWFSLNAPKPKPKTIEEEAAAVSGLSVKAPSAPKVQMREEPMSAAMQAGAAVSRAVIPDGDVKREQSITPHDVAYQQRAQKAVDAQAKAGLQPMVPAGGYSVEEDVRPTEQVVFSEGKDDSEATKIAKGGARGLAKTSKAMVEPKNLAIMGGIAAVNALQAIPGSQLVTVPLAQATNATAATYFGAEMAASLPEQYREYTGALERGDTGGAAEALTGIGATTALSATGFRHGVGAAKPAVEARMGAAKPVITTPPPLANPRAQVGSANWENLSETRGTLPTERPVDLPAEVPYAEAMRQRESARAAQNQRGSTPVDQAQRKAELKARFRPEPPPEPMGVTPGKPAPLQPLGELVFKSAKESAEAFKQEGAKSAEQSAEVFSDASVVKTPAEFARADARRSRRRFSSQGGALDIPNPFRRESAPPPQKTLGEKFALEEAAKREAAKAEESSFLSTIKDWRNKYRTNVNDTTVGMTDPLKPLDALAGKTEVKPTTRMNDLIDKALRSPTIASRMLRDAKIPEYAWDVKSLDLLDQYMIARRSLEVEGAGFKTGRDAARDRQIVTDLENMEAIPASKGRPAMTYGHIAKEYTNFNNGLMDAAAQSGIVSKDLAAYLKDKYQSYIPIERWQEAYGHAHSNARGASQIASLARQTVVQKLTGSDRIIDSSILSTIHRADSVIGQITRNNAARYLTDQLKRLDPGDGSVIRPKQAGEHVPADRVVSQFVDGVKQEFVVDQSIATAAKSIDVKQLGWAMENIFAPMTRVLKLGTTGVNLKFAAVNFVRDLLATAVTLSGKPGIAAVADPRILWKAGKAIMPKSETMREMELAGSGFTSYDLSRGQAMPEIKMMRMWKHPGEYAKNVKEAVKDLPRNPKRSISKIASPPVRSIGALLRATENAFGKTELFGRARIYEAVKRDRTNKGFAPEDVVVESAQAANTALPNYARAGSVTRVLNPVIPYLGAGIRGVVSFTQALERSPMEAVGKIATGATAVAAVTAWNLVDPERREKYLGLDDWERRDNLIILGPNTKKNAQGRYENLIKIPLPQGINYLLDVARKSVEEKYTSDPVGFNDWAEALIGAFTPINPAPVSDNIAVNVGAGALATALPQTIKPGVQSLANYNFYTGKPIESGKLQELPPAERAYPHTSSAAKYVAREVLPKLGVKGSPVKTEAFVRDTFGGGAQVIIPAADAIVEGTGLMPKQAEHGVQGPVDTAVRAMTSAGAGEYDRKFYDLRKQLQDTIAQQEIDIIRQSTDLDALDRETRTKLMNQALGRAKSQVQKIMTESHIDEVEGSDKVAMMKQILDSFKQ